MNKITVKTPLQQMVPVMTLSGSNNVYSGGEFTFFGEKHKIKCNNQLNNFSCSVVDASDRVIASFSRGSIGAGWGNVRIRLGF
jgi:hypothetical protein